MNVVLRRDSRTGGWCAMAGPIGNASNNVVEATGFTAEEAISNLFLENHKVFGVEQIISD